MEESLAKIENDKKNLFTAIDNEETQTADSSSFDMENIKSTYNATITELELKRNEIMKKIEEYKSDGSEKWDSFKHKLNHDLEELGKALKGFATPAH